MTWADEVHNSRFQTAIARATAERRLRKRGLPVPVMETAKVGPVVAMVALASSLLAWQQWGGQVKAAMAHNPLVQQFRSLVFGSGASAPRQVGTKSASGVKAAGSGKVAAGGKVAARRPAAVATPSPSQAAAAAAEARIAAATASAAAQARQAEFPQEPACAARIMPSANEYNNTRT
ncbi:hypothetical protein GPECTOR_1g528 [Gonium pectorale]|uniref:Uncharacterized protein n=1 Tax=Gonium pectorale TaxID=33097 RepID=A0A150H331_GONPE|nr:hypothetical protein GPECTOR_1g528 [Gonium pectorale]|eukprot:KXZ56587.1 hypothetical protein GPECTOR_1g528 [Gonium pectorale]